jgi:hypothetical protein
MLCAGTGSDSPKNFFDFRLVRENLNAIKTTFVLLLDSFLQPCPNRLPAAAPSNLSDRRCETFYAATNPT